MRSHICRSELSTEHDKQVSRGYSPLHPWTEGTDPSIYRFFQGIHTVSKGCLMLPSQNSLSDQMFPWHAPLLCSRLWSDPFTGSLSPQTGSPSCKLHLPPSLASLSPKLSSFPSVLYISLFVHLFLPVRWQMQWSWRFVLVFSRLYL